MRYFRVKQIHKNFELLTQVHQLIITCLENKQYNQVVEALESSLLTMQEIKQILLLEKSLVTQTIETIEGYLQLISAIYAAMTMNKPLNINEIGRQLNECLHKVVTSFDREVDVEKKKIVFMPYKAAMWDSMASVWQAAMADNHAQVSVVPIPYYDRCADGSLGKFHDERNLFPKEVSTIAYDTFELASEYPDIIIVHNPYDEYNHVTSVAPDFYTSILKNYTAKLVYIPYFVLDEAEISIESIRHFANTPAVLNAHQVILQSEKMKELYVQALVEEYGDATRPEWQGKILGIGSPKLDATNLQTANIDLLPESWKQKLYKADGSRKKVIFYNTSMGAFLENSQAMLLKILDVFQVFKAQQEETVLLWRPHPLMLSTIQSMRPELTAIYQQLVQQYLKDDFGIYDDTPDLHRSLALADAYYGDHSSLVKICKEANIPVMIQNVNVLTNLS